MRKRTGKNVTVKLGSDFSLRRGDEGEEEDGINSILQKI